jgi:signal peptidase I
LTATLKRLWKNEYFQTVVIIGLIAVAVLGFWYTVQIALDTPDPALVVVSGSMCIPQDGNCNGWTHPFARTLHIGDMIIIQGVNPADLNLDYPNSDIIVFHNPTNPSDLIVHRIVSEKVSENGTIYFTTKGDGNGNKWPGTPDLTDPWGPVSQNLVVGKVVLRIPWVGHLVLFMKWLVEQPFGLPIIIALIILLVVIEFIAPLLNGKKQPAAEPERQMETEQQP